MNKKKASAFVTSLIVSGISVSFSYFLAKQEKFFESLGNQIDRRLGIKRPASILEEQDLTDED